jgi:hypothetical protein
MAIVKKHKEKPCTDCRVPYPYYVMDFDHRDLEDKEESIGKLVSKLCSVKKLEAEIAKCDVVCSNCHRERTHRQREAGLFDFGKRSTA